MGLKSPILRKSTKIKKKRYKKNAKDLRKNRRYEKGLKSQILRRSKKIKKKR